MSGKSVEWIDDALEAKPDPVSGACITRITGGGVLYCESPKASPDGSRFVLQRGNGYFVCDITTKRFTAMAEGCILANSPYSDDVYCWYERDGKVGLDRVRLTTLDRVRVTELTGLPKPGAPQSVSPAGDYLIYHAHRPPTCLVIRVELPSGSWNVIHEDPDIINGHIQVDPRDGRQILLQQNRGGLTDANGKIVRLLGPEGATHYVIRSDGTGRCALPVGPPHTSSCSGHSSWIGGTRRAVLAVAWNMNEFQDPSLARDWTLDMRYLQSNVFTVAPGDTRPTPFIAPEQRFFHVSGSKCGRYFVANSVPNGRLGPTEIVIGNLVTGNYRTLIHDCLCYAGSVWPSSLPYLTADLRHVVFRAKEDPSLPGYQGFYVYVAAIPDRFLADLG
jgi:hypothetical protein